MLADTQIVAVLREAIPGLIAVYRFGSTASGRTHAASDVDLAVLATAPLAATARFDLQERLAARLHRDVDLVDLRAASTVMRMQVVSTGTLLAAIDPAAQEQFEDLTYSAYARLNEERREILEQVRREGRVHGG
jgi:predicted nucleotidyltransferase